ncbi:ABC transporter permease [Bacteroides sp. 519]|uniref:ABC transporter permease n=1 Tax=Bacteroides sp. 519 TaxID=2302937 RepID=UPI0013D83B9D|nr:ABC transporter permease [Bacteroides sp. 519]NDV59567.1 ABC transporter permease [Bacteroides sp. 519]
MILHYVKIALRNLLKHKSQTIVSVLGITAGILCFSICTYFMRALYRSDSDFPRYKEMAVLRMQYPDTEEYSYPRQNVVKMFAEQFHSDMELIIGMEYSTKPYNVTIDDTDSKRTVRIISQAVNADFVQAYPPELIAGSLNEFSAQPDRVFITEQLANKLFGKESPIGKTFSSESVSYKKLDTPIIFTVVGVMKPYPSYAFDNPLSFEMLHHAEIEKHAGYFYTYILKPEININDLNERLGKIEFNGAKAKLVYKHELREMNPAALFVAIIGLLVLLAGLLNFLNIAISAFANRIKELSIRKTLGALLRHQFFILFTELLFILILSFLFCMMLTETLIPYLLNQLPHMIARELEIDLHELVRQQVFYFVYILLFCSLIAWVGVFRIKVKQKYSKHYVRNVLLGVQFFICIVFVLATGATYLVSKNTLKIKTPYLTENETTNIACIRLGNERVILKKHIPEIVDYIHSSPLFEGYTFVNESSYNISNSDEQHDILVRHISPEYMNIMGVPIERKPKEGEPCCYVNEALFEKLNKDSVDYIRINNKTYPVAQTIEAVELGWYLKEVAFIPDADISNPDYIYVQMKKGKSQEGLFALQEKIQAFLPEYNTFEIYTLKTDHLSGGQSLLQGLFTACSIISILITILGLYGAITTDTQRRQKEIAIRKINGAEMRNIYYIFGKLYVCLFIIAGIAVCSIGFFIFNLLSSNFNVFFDYKDPLYWIASFLFVILIIFCTISYRIYKISRINPADIIRND